MEHKEKLQMFESVFAPKPAEKVLFIIDMAHGSLDDSDAWAALREMA